MKKLVSFFIATLFMCSTALFAQKPKVLESSKKKKPEWVNGIVKDYIIVTGSADNIETAQSNALLKVKERIITSIAENVSTSSEFYRKENTANGISNIIENFETSTKTKSADIAYLKGISLSQVEEFYWEKLSENNKVRVYYHLKYPFSEAQINKLVSEFERADREMTRAMNDLLDSIESASTVEKLGEIMASLMTLQTSFIDQRKDKCSLGISKIQGMLKSISIYPISTSLGEIKYTLKLGTKPIYTAGKPRVQSNCAKIIETLNNSDEWTIRYEYAGCYADPSNAVTVTYNFNGVNVKNSFTFDVNAKKAEVTVRDIIMITGGNDNGSSITGAKCQITVYSKFDSPVTIEKLTLNWDNHAPVVIAVNQQIKGKGNHELNLTIDTPLEKVKTTASVKNMISGIIQYKAETGESITSKMYNQSVKTSW